jgi:hypothetical protein
MDRRTDVTKLIVAFRNFVNAPKKSKTYYTSEYCTPYYSLISSSVTDAVINLDYITSKLIPVAVWSKAWVCSCLLAGIESRGGMDICLLLVSCVVR